MISPALRVARSPQLYNPVPDGCVLYLPLWHPELSGTVFNSVDDFRHTPTVTGTTWGATGRTFDGTTDIITVPDSNSLDLTTGCSIGMWIKLLDTPAQYDELLIKGIDKYEINFPSAPGSLVPRFYLTCADGAVLRDGVGLSLNTWYHLVATYDAVAGAKVYTNTASSSTTAQKGNITTDNTSLSIGGSASRKLPAIFGEIWLYNRALTAAEVLHSYNTTNWRYQ